MQNSLPHRKRDILQAAQRLFAEKGYHGTPTSEIATLAGVAQGTLFYHFKSKEGILLSLLQQTTGAYLKDAQDILKAAPSGLQGILDLIERHLEFCTDHQEELKILLRDIPADVLQQNSSLLQTGTRELMQRLQSTYREALERGIKDTSIRPLKPRCAAWIVHSCTYGLIKHVIFGTPGPPNLHRETIEFFRHSLANPDNLTHRNIAKH
ncbi:MAG: TetR/AcrR family transcriptional regulator [Thermodesulfobacteriota bacterium]|nr:TetR/AcrR family transcriptional regulator [Thermodesulfobacteriota bacterium]